MNPPKNQAQIDKPEYADLK